MLKCKVCGTANSPDSSVCANCGEKLRVNRKSSTGKRKKAKRDPQRRRSSEPKDIFSTSDYQKKENSTEPVIMDVFSSEEAYEKVRKGTVLEKIHVLEEEIGDTTHVIDDEPEEQKIVPTVINRSTTNDIIRSFDSPKGAKNGKGRKHDIPHRVIRSVKNPGSGKKFESKASENSTSLKEDSSDKKTIASVTQKASEKEAEAFENDSNNSVNVGVKKRRSNKKKRRRPQSDRSETKDILESKGSTEVDAKSEHTEERTFSEDSLFYSENTTVDTEKPDVEEMEVQTESFFSNSEASVDDVEAEAESESADLDAELFQADEVSNDSDDTKVGTDKTSDELEFVDETNSEESEEEDFDINVVEIDEAELDEVETAESGFDVIALDQIADGKSSLDEADINEKEQAEVEQENSDSDEDDFFSVDNEEDESEDSSYVSAEEEKYSAEESEDIPEEVSDISPEDEITSDISEDPESYGRDESQEKETAKKEKHRQSKNQDKSKGKTEKKKRKKKSAETTAEQAVKKSTFNKTKKNRSDAKKEETGIKSRNNLSSKKEKKTPEKEKQTSVSSNFSPEDIEENRYVAALSYLGILLILPLFKVKESDFCRAHVKQGVRVLIYSFVILILTLAAVLGLRALLLWTLDLNVIIYKVLAFVIAAIMALLIFIPSFKGALCAFSGTYKKVPFVGKDIK